MNKFLSKESFVYFVQLIKQEFTKYVQSVDGKGLSTEDFTTELKQKLEDLGASESFVYIPNVSESGDLSWTNNGGLENPAPVNIKGGQGIQGLPGNDGADGVSVTHSWDGTVLYVTSASGKSSADLKGEKGSPGYTPVKGTDYYTETEKQELINEITETVTGDIETALDTIISIQRESVGG